MVMDNKDIRLKMLILKYDEHTLQLSKILNEITEKDLYRFDVYSKSVPWIVGGQVSFRFQIANVLGIEINPSTDQIFRTDGTQLYIEYPSLETFRKDWEIISPILKNEILELDNEELFTFSEEEPKMKGSFFDLLSFMIERERENIDALILWRGLLT